MRTKIILFMIFVVLFVIIISQNSGVIPVKILFWEFQASEIVVVAMTGLIGLLLGFILASIFSGIGKRKNNVKIQAGDKTASSTLNNDEFRNR